MTKGAGSGRQRRTLAGAVGLILLCAIPPCAAEGLEDRHLPFLLRTAEDAARATALAAPPAGFMAPEPGEDRPAGEATSDADGRAAFSQPSANLPEASLAAFMQGRAFFNKVWIAAPAATPASDGLGPLFNARSCEGCHVRDGRGRPPEGQDPGAGFVLRLSLPGGISPEGIEEWLATTGDPVYGGQLQDRAAPGLTAEGQIAVARTEQRVTLADGTVVTLSAPRYSVAGPGYGPLADGVLLSPRVAQQMIGMGLLEAIPTADILAREDPDDANGDGISGRAQIVPSREFGAPMLGRFGHKAATPTVREQLASAFAADMGLATALYPEPWGDCTAAQPACRGAPHGQGPGADPTAEVDAADLNHLAHYARNLAVPARRNAAAPEVLRGKAVFHALNCSGCHVPRHLTHRLAGRPEQSFQLIWPYTDLLLHDMGPGLADNRPEGRASGREWRTPPLWGIGLTEAVSGAARYLHDGRARSLMEAILWHGGEAQAARDGVVALPAADRAALIAFLESL